MKSHFLLCATRYRSEKYICLKLYLPSDRQVFNILNSIFPRDIKLVDKENCFRFTIIGPWPLDFHAQRYLLYITFNLLRERCLLPNISPKIITYFEIRNTWINFYSLIFWKGIRSIIIIKIKWQKYKKQSM